MQLLVFSTHRQIRNYLSKFNNTILDKYTTIGEFLNNIVVVKDKKFIDNDIRKIYLFKAIENIDISKLGFRKEFLSFSKDSEFVFSFLKEIFIERVELDEIIMADTYIEYEEHLKLIKEIKNNYKKLLDENGYIDTFLIEEYQINKGLLDGVDEIEIFLDGYLSKWDIEVLEKIEIPIKINLNVTKFNRPLIRKFLVDLDEGYRYKIDFKTKNILEKKEIISTPDIKVSHFSKKFDEINFVFAKIAEFVEAGLNPDKIAVILPDESFSEFLEEFDEYQNLNFAMGSSFIHSNLYIKLKALYEYHINNDEINKIKAGEWIEEFGDDVIGFIRTKASNKELRLIDEELFKLERFKNLFSDKYQYLHFILEKLKEFSFDDVYSGKVTVMGVLESRGIEYDGVIIVNFNDGVVPNVNSKDLFLNTAIRKKANLPTRGDKENLQKHYYYSLIRNSKKVAISYIKNESENVSRFLYELGLELGENEEDKYKEVLYKFNKPKFIPMYDEKFEVKRPITPSSLKVLLECPKKYYFSKILEISNPSEEDENFGLVLHDVLEEIAKDTSNISSKDEYFEEVMNGIYKRLNSKKDIYEIRVKFEDGIKKFCEEDYESMKYANHIKVEEWLSVGELSAKVDRVDLYQNEIVLIDYKTGKVDNLLKHPYEFQPTFYYLWAKENYPDKNIKVIYWDIQNVQKVEAKIMVDELNEVLNNLPDYAREAEDIVVDEKVIKKASDICKWCDYKVACGR